MYLKIKKAPWWLQLLNSSTKSFIYTCVFCKFGKNNYQKNNYQMDKVTNSLLPSSHFSAYLKMFTKECWVGKRISTSPKLHKHIESKPPQWRKVSSYTKRNMGGGWGKGVSSEVILWYLSMLLKQYIQKKKKIHTLNSFLILEIGT